MYISSKLGRFLKDAEKFLSLQTGSLFCIIDNFSFHFKFFKHGGPSATLSLVPSMSNFSNQQNCVNQILQLHSIGFKSLNLRKKAGVKVNDLFL